MSKTNFDKWKEALTPEKMGELLHDHADWDCCNLREHCPAVDDCDRCHGKNYCKGIFIAWANERAEEGEVDFISTKRKEADE